MSTEVLFVDGVPQQPQQQFTLLSFFLRFYSLWHGAFLKYINLTTARDLPRKVLCHNDLSPALDYKENIDTANPLLQEDYQFLRRIFRVSRCPKTLAICLRMEMEVNEVSNYLLMCLRLTDLQSKLMQVSLEISPTVFHKVSSQVYRMAATDSDQICISSAAKPAVLSCYVQHSKHSFKFAAELECSAKAGFVDVPISFFCCVVYNEVLYAQPGGTGIRAVCMEQYERRREMAHT